MEFSVARVRATDGLVVGAAFLVTEQEVLTCAHVVERALGRSYRGVADEADAVVLLEFPVRASPEIAVRPLSARVTAWRPVRADDTGDVAVLTLDSPAPPGARPAPLVIEENLWEHRCRIFGFAEQHDHGIWVAGVLRARQAAGWIQLESRKTTGYAVEPGFSGAPVWDDDLAAVVGMAVAAEARSDLRAAYLIPTGVLTHEWPRLKAVVGPSRAGVPPGARRALKRSPRPAQLPHGVAHFTGREAELERLHAFVGGGGIGASGAVVITAIAGTAGVGKTALGIHWAHQIRDRFPDGQLYVNLRGFDPTRSEMAPAEAIRGFLDAFAVPQQRIPVSLDAQAALYRSLLAERRVLVVLDNAANAEQVRPLIPGSSGCLVLVTSRNKLTGLLASAGAYLLTVDLLSASDARQFLARRLGPHRVAAEPRAVDEIIASCSGLPLALTIVAARAASHPEFPLAVLATELSQARGGLDAFGGEDKMTDPRAVFSWSYQHLSGAASRLFRLLSVHPGPDIASPAAASLIGVQPVQARSVLAELTEAHLISEPVPGRFAFHDLLRAYAAELARTVDSATDRREALHRMLDHYQHTARAGYLLLDPNRNPVTMEPPRPGVTPVGLTDHEQAMAWFATEYAVLLAAFEEAVKSRLDTHTWQLAWALSTFLHRKGHWHDLAASQRAALDAGRALGDRRVQAHANRHLARAYTWLDRHNDARAHYRNAQDLFEELGDESGQAHTHRNLAWLLGKEGNYLEALGHARQALGLFRAAGHRVGQAEALNAVGWFHAQLGDYEQALTYCQQALVLHQHIRHREGEASAWDSLGYAHHHLGHDQQAASCYQRAVDLWREIGDRYYEAETLIRLGEGHHSAGDPDSARNAWRLALTILDELHHPEADRLRVKLSRLTERPAVS